MPAQRLQCCTPGGQRRAARGADSHTTCTHRERAYAAHGVKGRPGRHQADEQYSAGWGKLTSCAGDPRVRRIPAPEDRPLPEEVTASRRRRVNRCRRGDADRLSHAINTDVGTRRRRARQRHHGPLRTHLKNGDIIEIMTAAGDKRARLARYATNSRALQDSGIHHGEEKTRSLEHGRRISEEARRSTSAKILSDDARQAAAGARPARIDD